VVVVIICSVLTLAGLVLIVAWGGLDLRSPAPAGPSEPLPPAQNSEADSLRSRARRALARYAWWATVVTVAGAASGVLMAGAGGRIVMRVLALTSPLADGRVTEAQATVGRITPEGTLALLLFGALPGAFLSAILFALIHRWLPRGRLGGAVFGVVLVLLFATTLDPLRADNIDFDIVGPGWLSVVLLSALVILHGMLVAAIAGWYSRRLPTNPRRAWPVYSPLLAAVLYIPAGIALAVGAVLALLGAAVAPAIARWWASPAATRTGRTVLAILVVLMIPGFAGAVASILSR
jgi:hypothetical protein